MYIYNYIYIVVFLLKGDTKEKAAFGRQHIYFQKLKLSFSLSKYFDIYYLLVLIRGLLEQI